MGAVRIAIAVAVQCAFRGWNAPLKAPALTQPVCTLLSALSRNTLVPPRYGSALPGNHAGMHEDGSLWPLFRQATGPDKFGFGPAAQSETTQSWIARTQGAEIVKSICPYCAVGCGQNLYVRDGELIQIEGDPDSPISRGRLCPKGSATRSLVQSPLREYRVKYRRPYGTRWEEVPLDEAMEMIAQRVLRTRRETWETKDEDDKTINRCYGIASLGGATLDNEENYLMKKLYTALGIVQVENQARI